MRGALAIAVLLAVVSVALVAVCEHSEVCRLEYRVWEVERRRDSLERQLREIDAKIAATLTPRSLLEEADREQRRLSPGQASFPPVQPTPQPRPSRPARPARHEFRDLQWFEEHGR